MEFDPACSDLSLTSTLSYSSMLVSLQQIFRKPLKTALSFGVTGAYDARRLWYRSFTVLALESSADDTCAAVVNSSRTILSNIVLKQHDLCAELTVILLL